MDKREMIATAFKDTYDKYGSAQLVEAINQRLFNNNESYFTKRENRKNLKVYGNENDITNKDLTDFMLTTILEHEAIYLERNYAMVLGTKTNLKNAITLGEKLSLGQLDEMNVIIYQEFQKDQIGTIGNEFYQAVLRDRSVADKVINTFVGDRYDNQILSDIDYRMFEIDDSSIIFHIDHSNQLNNNIYK